MESMHYRRKVLILLIITVLLSFFGCGALTSNSKTPSKNKNVFTKQEIRQLGIEYNVTNAFDLVNFKRPSWLYNLRGEVVVFHNGMRYGGPESLRDFYLPTIYEIRRVGLEGSSKYVRSDRPTVVILVETE